MKAIFRFLGIALFAVVLAGCSAAHGDNAQGPDFQLKMYKVPAAQSKAIAGKLDGILASPEFLAGLKTHTTMRATTPFPGAVLVLAPASVQPSIATAVAELAKVAGSAVPDGAANDGKAKAPESVPLRVQFWVVQAKAGAGDDAAALQALEPALKRVRSSLGTSHFVVDDSASALIDAPTAQNLAAGNGVMTTSRGHTFGFHAVADVGGSVSLEVNYASTDPIVAAQTIPKLRTTVSLHPGEYVVLAEANPANAPAKTSAVTLLNLLVVRVDHADAATH